MIVIGGWGHGNQKPITIMEVGACRERIPPDPRCRDRRIVRPWFQDFVMGGAASLT
jgi:hypothetical protein